MRLLFPALLLAAGCYNEPRYDADYDQAFCDKVFECSDDMVIEFLPYQSAAECVDYFAPLHEQERAEQDESGEDRCDFDAASAQDCVDQTTAMGCVAYEAGNFPAVCDDVCGLRG